MRKNLLARTALHSALLPMLGLLALPACSSSDVTTALATPAGQLFCAVQTSGGGTVVVGLINAEVSGVAPGAAPAAIIATGAAEAAVNADCAAAKGIPVSPPVNPATAPQVAVVPAA